MFEDISVLISDLLQEDETIHCPKRVAPTRRDQGICYTMIQMNPNKSKDLVNSSYPYPNTFGIAEDIQPISWGLDPS